MDVWCGISVHGWDLAPMEIISSTRKRFPWPWRAGTQRHQASVNSAQCAGWPLEAEWGDRIAGFRMGQKPAESIAGPPIGVVWWGGERSPDSLCAALRDRASSEAKIAGGFADPADGVWEPILTKWDV